MFGCQVVQQSMQFTRKKRGKVEKRSQWKSLPSGANSNSTRPSHLRIFFSNVTTQLLPPFFSPTMSSLISPEFSRVLLLAGIVAVHVHWRQLITRLVPEPYLDEVFHVPQAQAYWAGKWSQWDSKITTPPGLYLFSYGVNSIRSWFQEPFEQSTEELRFSNSLLLYLLLVILYVWSAVTRREVHHEAVLQREFSIVLFPLLFFFSGLYYTDLFSVFTVVVTYVCWSAARRARGGMKMVYQILHVVSGLVALATRQTNIFWVAVYLGGLQVVQSTKREAGVNMIHDPPISEAFFEGQSFSHISNFLT